MPPPSDHPSLHLQVQPEPFFIFKLGHVEAIPSWVLEGLTGTGGFFSVTRTKEEISIVGESHLGIPEDVKKLSTLACIKIMGPMEHDLTGIMAEITSPLKAVEVPVFAISTWNTDYILVPKERVSTAAAALAQDSWEFVQ